MTFERLEPSPKAIRDLIDAILATFDNVERTFPLGRGELEITMTDKRKFILRLDLSELPKKD